MGQKVHPKGLRLGIIKTWDSRWFGGRHFVDWLHEDIIIRNHIREKFKNCGISNIAIERADKINVTVHTARPGLLIGKRGAGIEELRKDLENLVRKEIRLNVEEIRHPELDAKLVAESIAGKLEKRIAFRKAMKLAAAASMKAGAKGIKIECAGRLAGAEIARRERVFEGKIPLHTLRADIDYACEEAYTTYGRIGIKVWIYKGDVLPEKKGKTPVAEEVKSDVTAEKGKV